MATIQQVTRKFLFKATELPNIDSLTPEQIQEHYSTFHPEIVNAQIQNKGINEKGELVYEFALKAGVKG